jgi:hypothetical protein
MAEPQSPAPEVQRYVGIAMLAVSLVVGVLALGGRRNALVAGLVPFVDWPFGLGFLAVQALFCAVMRFKEGFLWMAGAVLLSAPALAIGNLVSQRMGSQAVTGLDRVVGGAALFSGCVVGWCAWKAAERS